MSTPPPLTVYSDSEHSLSSISPTPKKHKRPLTSTPSSTASTDQHKSKSDRQRSSSKYCSFCNKCDWNLRTFDKRTSLQIQKHFGVKVRWFYVDILIRCLLLRIDLKSIFHLLSQLSIFSFRLCLIFFGSFIIFNCLSFCSKQYSKLIFLFTYETIIDQKKSQC